MISIFLYKFSLTSSIVPLSLLSILKASVLNFIYHRLFAFILFSYVSGTFSCSFLLDMFLCPHFVCLFLFVSMYYINLLYLPVMVGWPCIIGVLWGSVCSLPSYLSLVLQGCSLCRFVCPPVVVKPWLLLAHPLVGLTLKLTGCEDWLWVGFSLEALWCLPSPPFVCVACGANWMLFCMVWSWSVDVQFLEPLERDARYRPRSVPVDISLGAIW